MAKRRKLSWVAREGRWRGSWKASGAPESERKWFTHYAESKVASEAVAYAKFRDWISEREQSAIDPHRQRWERLLEWLAGYAGCIRATGDSPGTRADWAWVNARIDHCRQAIDAGWPYVEQPTGDIDVLGHEPKALHATERAVDVIAGYRGLPISSGGLTHVAGLLPQVANAPAGPAPWEAPTVEVDKTVGGNVRRWLAERRREVDRGNLSASRYDSLRTALDAFSGFVGDTKPVEAIDEQTLANYREALLSKVHDPDKKFSAITARDHLQAVRQLVNSLWERRLLDLPRNLRSRDMTISPDVSAIEVFTLEDIAAIIGRANDRTQLYVLLALNTGMTQADIAGLRHDQIDLDAGIVTRKRGKTARFKTVPTVTYKLWPRTAELLRASISGHAELALTNLKGEPLQSKAFNAKGELAKIDNIRSAFERVTRSLGIRLGFKALRKTAATALGSHAEHGRYAQHFLGHAPRTVADRHYVRPSQEAFDAAVSWLGAALGIAGQTPQERP